MAGLEAIEVIAHFQIRHAHHPLHQVLSMGVEPFAAPEWFDQQIEQLGFGGCVGHGLGFSSPCVPSASAKPDGGTSPFRGVVGANPWRRLPHLRGRRLMTPLNVTCLLGVR